MDETTQEQQQTEQTTSPDVVKLQAALKSERQQRIAFEKQFQEVNGKLSTYEQERQQAEQRKLEEKGDFEKIKTSFQSTLQAKDQEVKGWQDRYSSKLLEIAVLNAASGAKVKEGAAELLVPVASRHLRLGENDRVIVVDSQGKERLNEKTGDTFTLNDLFMELRLGKGTGYLFDPMDTGSGSDMKPATTATVRTTGTRTITKAEFEASGGKYLEAVAKGDITVLMP